MICKIMKVVLLLSQEELPASTANSSKFQNSKSLEFETNTTSLLFQAEKKILRALSHPSWPTLQLPDPSQILSM